MNREHIEKLNAAVRLLKNEASTKCRECAFNGHGGLCDVSCLNMLKELPLPDEKTDDMIEAGHDISRERVEKLEYTINKLIKASEFKEEPDEDESNKRIDKIVARISRLEGIINAYTKRF